MPRPISAEFSAAALTHNLNRVRQHVLDAANAARARGESVAPPAIWAVIKANAYGHGIERAVKAFSGAQGLAMLDFAEAIRCREAGWGGPILMLEGFFEPADIEWLERYHLTTVIHCDEQLAMLARARVSRRIGCFVKLNSGMNRLGFAQADYSDAFARAQGLQKKGVLGQIGKMTHFANADGEAGIDAQMMAFTEATQKLPGMVSVCNSAATWRFPEVSLAPEGQTSWVRPGICLYGSSPFDDCSAESLDLRPAMTLSSRIIGVQTVSAQAGVGYGSRYRASRAMRVGVVACGYADGYPRHAEDGTPVMVCGRRTQLIGRVSMDMLMVDLSHHPEADVGSPVVLWGNGGPSVDEVARHSGTIGYELLCAVAPRVPRRDIA